MAKYSNLDVLSNIKLNGAIYTETSGLIKPAIKYDEVNKTWVYKNEDSGSWIRFSKSDFNLISSLTQLPYAVDKSVPNCNVMTGYIN